MAGLIVLITPFFLQVCQADSLKAVALKCEYRVNPLGIDTREPRLSWVLSSNRRGGRQAAWEVLVASTKAKLAEGEADLWDSGKVSSSDSINIIYSGKQLASSQRAWWKVRIWGSEDESPTTSEPAWFEMGLLSARDWKAQWIQSETTKPLSAAEAFDDHPGPILRKEFVLEKAIARARAYVSGLGYYELRLNGERVGDQVLDPGWTTYSKRVFYSTYDITAQLERGRNAVGILLGNGWFNPLPLGMWGWLKPGEALTVGTPRAIMQILVEFADGSTQVIVTDENWRVSEGPILRNSVYLGEVYDARREQPGWDKPQFNDSAWEHAKVAVGPDIGPLQAQYSPPIRITRTVKPVKLTEPKPGVFVFDFGQNFAGCVRLRVRGESGDRVRLRSGELLYSDGSLNAMTAVAGQIKQGGKDYHYDGMGKPKTAFQIDEYILNGRGREVFTPRFTFHGFRYVEVTGFPGKPTLGSLDGLRLNADVQPVGSFECSNEMLNRIQHMVLWTELSNLFSVQSDCPHREKLGYGGDLVASSEMAMLNFDMCRFYAKTAQDFVDAARPNGGFTETAPFVGISDQSMGDDSPPVDLGEKSGPIDFGTVQPFLAWQLFRYYGDRRTMEAQYEDSKRWIALLHSRAINDILDNGISDHESLVPKPRALTGTAFYYLNVELFARIAKVLGKDADALEAQRQAESIRIAYNKKFLEVGSGRYFSASQACQAFSLYMGLVPADEQKSALDVLVGDIMDLHKGHLSTGIFGTKFMLNALTDLGQADVAYHLVNQRTFPGWGYMLENGATTLWEHWEGSDNVYSQNHPMFGSVSEWFYKALAGIKPAQDAVGFDKIIIQPEPVGDLKWVKGSYQSVRGKIISEWTKTTGCFKLHIQIPIGATATVFLPAQDEIRIREGRKPIRLAPGVQFLRMEEGKAVLTVGSGDFAFESFMN